MAYAREDITKPLKIERPGMIQTVIALLSSSGIASLLTWLISKRTYDAAAKGSELDNVDHAVKIWRGLASDLEVKLDALTKKCDELTTELYHLRDENRMLRKQIEKFSKTLKDSNEKP